MFQKYFYCLSTTFLKFGNGGKLLSLLTHSIDPPLLSASHRASPIISSIGMLLYLGLISFRDGPLFILKF